MMILGINAYHGDASAAALRDGQLVAAVEEERFNRIKHAAGFPDQALRYVARAAKATPEDSRLIAVARDPWARVLEKAIFAMRVPSKALGRLRAQGRFASIANEVGRILEVSPDRLEIRRVEHHRAHLASAFFASPFEEAALFSVDGLGDFASTMWGVGRGSSIRPAGAVSFPHSLGIFYTALTQFLGFPRYGDEFKVMGLASYGEPEYLEEFRKILPDAANGNLGFRLGLEYFTHHRSGVEMTWAGGEPSIGRLYSDHLVDRLGKAREPLETIEQRHQNVAASIQARLEEVLLQQLRALRRQTGLRKLCLAGGVAFNCVANGKVLTNAGFEEIFIQPAAGDAGLAIGAALYVWHQQLGNPRSFVMEHSYWGPEFTAAEIRQAIEARRGDFERERCEIREIGDEDRVCSRAAERIAAGKVVGWFQGRMEWGPRALGNRSILADPRRPEMRDILNVKIKRRESFRPFAPSMLEEAASEYFEQSSPSPFMLMAYRVRADKQKVIPATTHVDGTGRPQTVNQRQNPLYYRLLREFGRQTGVPVLLNTSFNENEPVVHTPQEAIDCFLRTKMDVLVLGHSVIERIAEG